MKYILALFLSSTLLFSCDDAEVLTENEVPSIRYGTSFGHCLGLCQTDLEVSSVQVYFVQYAFDNSVPPITESSLFDSKEYDQLLSLVDEDKFMSLDPLIGCPDCADGGAEWIEIRIGNQSKKVTFEYGKDINGISKLVSELRVIVDEIKN